MSGSVNRPSKWRSFEPGRVTVTCEGCFAVSANPALFNWRYRLTATGRRRCRCAKCGVPRRSRPLSIVPGTGLTRFTKVRRQA